MKKLLIITAVALSALSPLVAYASTNVAGQTGLIATPTARISWEGDGGNIGVIGGYNYFNNGTEYHVPRVNVALFDRMEIGGAYNVTNGTNQNDLLLHSKLRFSPWSGRGNSALAIGGNYQSLNSSPATTVGQVYMAATYEALFFGMEADTTVVVGKTFGSVTRGIQHRAQDSSP